METITIKNSTDKITPNFTYKEFFNPPIAPARQEFDLYSCIPKSLQIFRDYFSQQYGRDICWSITSTYRPHDALNMPPAHRISPPAVDSLCSDRTLWRAIKNSISNELKNWKTSVLIQNVLATGLNVIIIENGCLHIHWRTDHNHHPDDAKYPNGLYLGEWGITQDGKQINIAYSSN